MNEITKQFLHDVRVEARAIRRNATAKEIGKLDVKTLNANHTERCIYGQMTGDCDSERAYELMLKCRNVRNSRYHIDGYIIDKEVSTLKTYIKDNNWYRTRKIFSPIEVYITYTTYKEHLELINYLKGETDSFKPTNSNIEIWCGEI